LRHDQDSLSVVVQGSKPLRTSRTPDIGAQVTECCDLRREGYQFPEMSKSDDLRAARPCYATASF
jgi:hypothetical protein